jgi:hypothetical protein
MTFPIGSQLKSRGGWRAVVVRLYDNVPDPLVSMLVWHDECAITKGHDENGKAVIGGGGKDSDLLTQWVEPRKGEFWVNVYEKAVWDYETKEKADALSSCNRLACVRVEWSEGQGL